MAKNKGLSAYFNLYWLYLAGIFLVLALPLLIFDPIFTPIGWGKTIVFRILVSILAFIFVCQIFFRKIDLSDIARKIKSISVLFWLFLAMLLFMGFSVIASFDPNLSLWGSPLRSGGFINYIFYAIFGFFLFLIVKEKDWLKIFNFCIFIGIIASIVAFIQQFGLFSKYLLSFAYRPVSVIGNPILVAIYLNFLIFICLLLACKDPKKNKKIFYIFCIILFIIVSVFLTQTRTAILAMVAGGMWFFYFYPRADLKKIKILSAILIVFAVASMFYLNSNFEKIFGRLPYVAKSAVGRVLSLVENPINILDSRLSAWKISWEAIKQRPLLGYGPENFTVAFDRYYDPALPRMGRAIKFDQDFQWWDRAHNFIFDIAVTSGIPALSIFLAFWGALFWQLQKTKKKKPDMAIASNGAQALILSYFIGILFIFDFFESYLLGFVFAGYALYLISLANIEKITAEKNKTRELIGQKMYMFRKPLSVLLFIALIWFIFAYNIKPLEANKQINIAYQYDSLGKCNLAISILKKMTDSENIISDYIRRSSTEVIHNCIQKTSDTDVNINYASEAILLLTKNINRNPYHLDNWIWLGEDANFLMEMNAKKSESFIGSKKMADLKNQALSYFEKALALSPKRQEVYQEITKNDIITGDYKSAESTAQKCINLNNKDGGCYWMMALANGYQKNKEKFEYYSELAFKNKYDIELVEALGQEVDMNIKINDYQALTEVYPKIINIVTDNAQKAQLYAALAAAYRDIGKKKEARESAMKALELMPEAKPIVDEFLKTL